MKEHEPCHIAFESFLDDGNASHLLLIERAEECGASLEYGFEIVDEPSDAVRTAAFQRPPRHRNVSRAAPELADMSLKDGVDML